MLATAITAAFAVGWLAYKADIFGFQWGTLVLEEAKGPEEVQKEAVTKPAAMGKGAVATGIVVRAADVDVGAELVVLEALDVPFVRAVGDIGTAGKDSVAEFVRGNAMDAKFGVTPMVGLGESDLLADARASAVVSHLLVLGVDRAKLQIHAPQKTADDAPVTVTGARVSVYAQAKRSPASILAGAPLDALGLVEPMPTPLQPAFSALRSQFGDNNNDPRHQPTHKARSSAVGGETRSSRLKERAQSRPKTVPKPDRESPDGMKELADAVRSAALRNANIDRRSVAGATVGNERSGVSVTMSKKPAADQPGTADAGMVGSSGGEAAASMASGEHNNAEATTSPVNYKIVGRYGWGVLVQSGNSIKSIKVGDALPDGSKLTKEASAVPE
jgi:hypothetical protein